MTLLYPHAHGTDCIAEVGDGSKPPSPGGLYLLPRCDLEGLDSRTEIHARSV